MTGRSSDEPLEKCTETFFFIFCWITSTGSVNGTGKWYSELGLQVLVLIESRFIASKAIGHGIYINFSRERYVVLLQISDTRKSNRWYHFPNYYHNTYAIPRSGQDNDQTGCEEVVFVSPTAVMYLKPEFERRVKIEAVKVLGNNLILNSCDIILFEEDKSIKKSELRLILVVVALVKSK